MGSIRAHSQEKGYKWVSVLDKQENNQYRTQKKGTVSIILLKGYREFGDAIYTTGQNNHDNITLGTFLPESTSGKCTGPGCQSQ